MTESERVGQLFMVGCPSDSNCGQVLQAVRAGDVGSVILTGRNFAGASTIRSTARSLQSAARVDGRLPGLFIAVDQEGGTVQALQGPGFDQIPSAREQGSSTAVAAKADAFRWGQQLKSAGVNLDLAPVLDTVPDASFARRNPPIGQLDREYGFDPGAVAKIGTAVVSGLLAAGVGTTIKHFPGLGRVTANTDTGSGVTDNVTTRTDVYLQPFQAGIRAGTTFVMMSTAIYPQIDSGPAAFSPTVIGSLLRRQLGFKGVVVSDDLGSAVQVQAWSPPDRALMFLGAGGDMVLTVSADQIAGMRAAVLARIAANAAFAQQVDDSVLRILTAKAAQGLG